MKPEVHGALRQVLAAARSSRRMHLGGPIAAEDAFTAFTDGLEGDCAYPYTDVVGLVTCARGNLIDPGVRRYKAGDPMGPSTSGRACALPWTHGDGSLASSSAVDQSWWAVKRAWPGVQGVTCAKLTEIRLTDAAIDALTLQTLAVMWADTVKRFAQAEGWPACAQLGTLSMAWAMGDAFEGGYPRFDRAAEAQDWAGCARECLMTQPPVPHARNAANVKLFTGAVTDQTIAQALATPAA
jgi:GH24 family phage-related lysozyme (muramidase)